MHYLAAFAVCCNFGSIWSCLANGGGHLLMVTVCCYFLFMQGPLSSCSCGGVFHSLIFVFPQTSTLRTLALL